MSALALYLAYQFFSGTNAYSNAVPHLDGLAFPPLSGETVFDLLCTWGALLAAALLTLGIRRLSPAASTRAAAAGPVQLARRVLAWQLPPRALLASWCGGLSVAEALGVAGWLGMNACWLGVGLQSILGGAFQAGWQDNLNSAAKLLGQMIAPNMLLLFLPIPHTNFIGWLTGVPRNRLIRFHRWLGHGTLWVITAHSTLYYAYWSATDQFWYNFSSWGTVGAVNNLAGSVAFFVVLILWGTSLSFVRRRFYELFFRFHIACFVAFFLLSLAHYPQCWLFFTPGLLLYAADLALRAGQMSNLTTVTAAAIDEPSGVATLIIPADKAMQHRALSEVWLLLPALSRWQWHPFSVASGSGSTLRLHIKQYGRFTQGLLGQLRQRKPLAVRLSGPMGSEVAGGVQLTPPAAWHRYDTVVMVCGGVGVIGMLSMLRAMVSQRAQQAQHGINSTHVGPLPRRVLFIWTARSMGEFLALDAALLRAATFGDGWLTFSLHLTGSRSTTSAASSKAALASSSSSFISSASAASRWEVHATALASASAPRAPGAAPEPNHITGCSGYGWSLLRPAQPLSFGPLHLAVVFVLTFFGGLCGALLGSSYLDEPSTQPWQGGMVIGVLVSAMALGLPFGLAIFPLHLFRYLRGSGAVYSGKPGAEGQVAVPYGEQALLEGQSCVADGRTVLVPGEGIALQASRGRPDVAAALHAAAAESSAPVVGVFAGGPAGLMRSVHLSVCQLNSAAGSDGPHFELHKESLEL